MLSLMMLIYVMTDDARHLNAIFKTGPRATSVVLAGDLVPVGTVLATPGVDKEQFKIK